MGLNFNKSGYKRFFDENYNFSIIFMGLLFLFSAVSVVDRGFATNNFALDLDAVFYFKIWKFFTYPLVYTDIWSLLFNAFAVFVFSIPLERTIGSIRLLIFYMLMSFILGSLAISIIIFFNLPVYTGFYLFRESIFISYAVLYPKNILHLYGVIPLPVSLLMLLMIGFDFLDIFFKGLSYGILPLINVLLTFLYLKLILKLNVQELFK